MELVGEQLILAPRDKVWQGLMDTATLCAAIPGCESVTEEGDGAYSAVVVAAVGPLRAKFRGRLQQQEMSPPQQYGLRFEGEGGIVGFAKGTALVTLQEAGEGGEHTRLSYRARAQIGGRLAQMGARLIDATAARMSSQFFGRFEELLSVAPNASGISTLLHDGPNSQLDLSRPVAGKPAVPDVQSVSYVGGNITLQMPAWSWALTVMVSAVVALWLGTH